MSAHSKKHLIISSDDHSVSGASAFDIVRVNSSVDGLEFTSISAATSGLTLSNWSESGTSFIPNTTDIQDLGDDTHRINTVYMASVLNTVSGLTLTQGNVQNRTFISGGPGGPGGPSIIKGEEYYDSGTTLVGTVRTTIGHGPVNADFKSIMQSQDASGNTGGLVFSSTTIDFEFSSSTMNFMPGAGLNGQLIIVKTGSAPLALSSSTVSMNTSGGTTTFDGAYITLPNSIITPLTPAIGHTTLNITTGGTMQITDASGNTNDVVTKNDITGVVVPSLRISTLGSGSSISNLGYDTNGNVVTGTTGTVKYSTTTILSEFSATTITHNLNSTDIIVQLKDNSGGMIIPNSVNNYQLNTVDVEVSISDTYRIIIIG